MKTSTALSLCLLSLSAAGCDQAGFRAEQEAMDFRIVGGGETTADPAVALLVMQDAQLQIVGTCTGTLVESSWILTAAHCVSTTGPQIARIGVYFGANALLEDDPNYIYEGEAAAAYAHEQWDPYGDPSQGNDMAMIQLSAPAPLQPIPVNRTPLDDSMLGAPVRLVGWGITGGNQQDSGIKRAVNSQLFEYVADRVNVGNGQVNTCSGDSGGPAFMTIGGQEVLMGVTSYGDADCVQNGISMRTDTFVPWIEAVMGQALPGGNGNGGGGGGGTDGQTGSSCATGDACASGLCATGGGGGGFCTEQCGSDTDCPFNFVCVTTNEPGLNVCAPDGDGGEGDDGAGGGLPGKDTFGSGGGGGGAGGDDDDDDSDDDSDDPGAAADGDDDGCNCNADGGAPTPMGLALLVLGLIARRRRH